MVTERRYPIGIQTFSEIIRGGYVLHEDEALQDMREVMQEFYQRLKMLEPKIKFCFITGITRISQLNIFSTYENS